MKIEKGYRFIFYHYEGEVLEVIDDRVIVFIHGMSDITYRWYKDSLDHYPPTESWKVAQILSKYPEL